MLVGALWWSIGYGAMEITAFAVAGSGMITIGALGSAFSVWPGMVGAWNNFRTGGTGVQPSSMTQAPAQGQPGAPSHPYNCLVIGKVYDSKDTSSGIEGARVKVVGAGIVDWGMKGFETVTSEGGRYRIELPDGAWIRRSRIYIEADHPNYHYPSHSRVIPVHRGRQFVINFPMDRLVGPRAALGNVKITFADENGNPATNVVRPGGWWGCHIEAFSPVTFDKPSGRHVPTGGEDRIELIDENINPGKLIMEVTGSTSRSQGEIIYRKPVQIFARGRVPSKYADGTPIPMNTDLKAKLVAHLNVT
mgnify:FL=1